MKSGTIQFHEPQQDSESVIVATLFITFKDIKTQEDRSSICSHEFLVGFCFQWRYLAKFEVLVRIDLDYRIV